MNNQSKACDERAQDFLLSNAISITTNNNRGKHADTYSIYPTTRTGTTGDDERKRHSVKRDGSQHETSA